MREFIDLLENGPVMEEPSSGTVISAKIGEEDEMTHYFLKVDGGWRTIVSNGWNGGVMDFSPTDEYPNSLEAYHEKSIIFHAPEPGERISTPIQILGFPESASFISPGGRPVKRIEDGIEFEGERFGLDAVSTHTRLSEQVFYNSRPQPIHMVLDELRHHPFAPYLRVFGSAAKKPLLKVPGDIDVFIDTALVNLPKDKFTEATRSLLQIANKHYGAFDPFILIHQKLGIIDDKEKVRKVLYCRNERATAWVPAKNSRALIAAGKAGIPLNDLHDIDLAERAPPTQKAEKFIKKHKEEFRQRYGDAWKGVLYATAWKLFGK